MIVGVEQARDMVSSAIDGVHLLSLDLLNPEVSSRDYQKLYFDRIDECSKHTGYTRYELHEMFKKYSNIETTKNQDVIFWRKLITSLRWWSFSNFDCMI